MEEKKDLKATGEEKECAKDVKMQSETYQHVPYLPNLR